MQEVLESAKAKLEAAGIEAVTATANVTKADEVDAAVAKFVSCPESCAFMAVC